MPFGYFVLVGIGVDPPATPSPIVFHRQRITQGQPLRHRNIARHRKRCVVRNSNRRLVEVHALGNANLDLCARSESDEAGGYLRIPEKRDYAALENNLDAALLCVVRRNRPADKKFAAFMQHHLESRTPVGFGRAYAAREGGAATDIPEIVLHRSRDLEVLKVGVPLRALRQNDARMVHVPADAVHIETRAWRDVKDARSRITESCPEGAPTRELERGIGPDIYLAAVDMHRLGEYERSICHRKRLPVPLALPPRLHLTRRAAELERNRLFIGELVAPVADGRRRQYRTCRKNSRHGLTSFISFGESVISLPFTQTEREPTQSVLSK